MELVADVQNAATFAGQAAQGDKQALDSLRCQHGCRLVQNQQAGFAQQCAHDFNPLPLANAQRVHRPSRVQLHAVSLGGLSDALSHLGQAELFVQAKPDIFSHRQGVEQAEMLKHHADAQRPRLLGVANQHGLAIHCHAARVRLDRAVNNLHQGRFARTVFAQHRMNLTGLYLQRDVLVGNDAWVSARDAIQL